MAASRRMAGRHSYGLSSAVLADTLDRHSHLDREQRAAFAFATGASGFALINGQAGSGKTTTLAAIREAYEEAGYRVQGLSWKHDVVQGLKTDGFKNVSTVLSELMRQARGRGDWDKRTVLVVDEAATIGTKHFAALLQEADKAGAKLIGVYGDKQYSSIERGGMLQALAAEHGAATLSTVYRARHADEKRAFNFMYEGRFRDALAIFNERGAIRWQATPEETRAALVKQWADDTAADPAKTRFVFAYTNAEVRELNQQMRAIRRDRGELGEDHALPTREGEQSFAPGDRIQFTATASRRALVNAGLFNGATGTVQKIEEGRITVALDGAKNTEPRVITFKVGANADAGEFDAIRHGYAGTVYKGQGRTLDQSYLLHSDQWRSATSYVAMSRHRDSMALFVSEKAEPWIMARGGLAGLTDKQHSSAAQSFAAWSEAKPDLAKRYGFADYVAYVQSQWADEKRLDPLDRLARQMGRVEETRAASAFVEGAQERQDTGRKPPLSIVAGIVGDYLRLCYDPAKDWLRWIAEDLRNKAAVRRSKPKHEQGRDDVHTKGAGASLENADRIRRDPLHELQSGVDAKGQRGRGVDRVPPRPGADPSRNDGLRPLRDTGGLDSARDYIRERLAEAAKETTRRQDGPKKASDYLKERGKGRNPNRDR